MKTSLLTAILSLILFTSCIMVHEGGTNANANGSESEFGEVQFQYTSLKEDDLTLQTNKVDEGFFGRLTKKTIKTHEFRDARTGMVVSSIAFPGEWTVISKPTYTMDQKIPLFLMQIDGPHNLKSFNTPIKFYLHYQNPQMNHFVRQSPMASMLRAETSSQQLMNEEVNARMQNSGFTCIGEKSMPRAERYIRNEMAKNGVQNATMDYLATEWKNNKGQRALATVVKIAMKQPLFNDVMTGWFYSVDYVFVDAPQFETVLDQMMTATENMKHNPQWKQYVAQLNHQRNQERMRQSQINHQNNMAARQASFNAHQKKMQGIWAALDANHASFMNRNFGAGSSASQQNFVNMINEEETVYNPLNGKSYQVNAFPSQTWMDSDGNTIQNNDLFYTPNGDINLNNREWTKVNSGY